MKTIKIRQQADDVWLSVSVLDADSRPGWIQVQQGMDEQWLPLEAVHPADQVALRVEGLARRRYEWVPPADRSEP